MKQKLLEIGDLGGSDEVKTAKFSSGDLREAKVTKGAAGACSPKGCPDRISCKAKPSGNVGFT